MNEFQNASASFLAVGPSNSLYRADSGKGVQHFAFTPYGFEWGVSTGGSSLAFNGQLVDAQTGLYLLGAGRRAYSPVVMRFISADRISPFGAGGVNAYAYCEGDPVNYSDNSGMNRHLFPAWFFERARWMSDAFVEGKLQNKGRPEARPYHISQRHHSFSGIVQPASQTLVGFHAAKTDLVPMLTGTREGRNAALKAPLKEHKKFGVDPYYFAADGEFSPGFYAGEIGTASYYKAKRAAQWKESSTVLSVYVANSQGLQQGLHYYPGLLKHPAKDGYPESPFLFQTAFLPRVVSRISLRAEDVRGRLVQRLRPNEV